MCQAKWGARIGNIYKSIDSKTSQMHLLSTFSSDVTLIAFARHSQVIVFQWVLILVVLFTSILCLFFFFLCNRVSHLLWRKTGNPWKVLLHVLLYSCSDLYVISDSWFLQGQYSIANYIFFFPVLAVYCIPECENSTFALSLSLCAV